MISSTILKGYDLLILFFQYFLCGFFFFSNAKHEKKNCFVHFLEILNAKKKKEKFINSTTYKYETYVNPKE
jgi:hypothetical protein